jgi:MYXO-CTERM domain-containing protein
MGTCDPATMTCSSIGCTKDTDCPAADFCKSDGTCTPKLPNGKACDASSQCQSDLCQDKVCNGLVASGNGLICAVTGGAGSSGDDGAFGVLGLMLAAAGLARRRRGGSNRGESPWVVTGSSRLDRPRSMRS